MTKMTDLLEILFLPLGAFQLGPNEKPQQGADTLRRLKRERATKRQRGEIRKDTRPMGKEAE